jgi:hypothetical protein
LLFLAALPFAHLLIRVPLLGRLGFVGPDGAIFTTPDFVVLSNRLPLYPILIDLAARVVPDRILAAQIVSALGCGLAAVAVALLAEEIAGIPGYGAWGIGSGENNLDRSSPDPRPPAPGPAFFASLFYALSPFAWGNGACVLAEGVFTALVAGCLAASLRHARTGDVLPLFTTYLLAGLAPLTRAEGWIAIVPAAYATAHAVRREMLPRNFKLAATGLAAFLPVLAWHLVVIRRGGYFAEFGSGASDLTFGRYISYVLQYLLFLPIEAGPLVLLAALVGRPPLARDAKDRRPALLLALLVAAWVLTLSVHWAWDLRFLIPPAALVSAWGGAGTARLLARGYRRTAIGVAVLSCLSLALFVPFSRPLRELGSELREVATCAKALSGVRRFRSTEIAATSFYLGRLVEPIEPDRVRPREVLLLFDAFGATPEFKADLEKRFVLETVCLARRPETKAPPRDPADIFRPGRGPKPAPQTVWWEGRAVRVVGPKGM